MAASENKPSSRSRMSAWWLASLIFHALLFGWILFLSPVRVIDLSTAPAKTSPSSARTAQVMEQVRERQAENLAGEVQALEEARRELATLEAQKRSELRNTFSNAVVSIEKIATAQTNAAKAQADAEAALKRVSDSSANLATTNAAVREAQLSAGRFQAEALEALALADSRFEPAYQAQAEANADQTHAAQAQAEAEGQLAGAAVITAKNAPAAGDLEEAKQLLQSYEAQYAAAVSNSIALSNSLPRLTAQATTASSAYLAAQQSGDKAAVDRAKQPARDTQKAAEAAQKNLTRALSDITKFQSRITEQASRIAKFSAKANSLETDPEAMRRNAIAKFREAQALQSRAATAQARATKLFANIGTGSTLEAPRPVGVTNDLASVYQSAVQTEAELTEAYRRFRATELAVQREVPLSRALELTDAVRPSRPDLTDALRNPQNNRSADEQRQAVMEARAQIAAMRSLADSMLAQARSRSSDSASGQQRALETLAAEDDNERAKDLTGAMRGGSGSGSRSGKGTGSGRAGSGNGGGSGQTSTGSVGGNGSGFFGGSDSASSSPPTVPKDLSAMPGRVIAAAAIPGRWMFVDSWYLLGPFDNTGRVSIDKQFPPETIIDLNATYVGKRGQPVRWNFHQSPQPRVVPPFDDFNPLASGASDGGANAFKARDLEYIIYYGYTELRAEQDCDVWIAIGSDDFSKLWIEDQLVWASGKQHKSWRVDEGFRKVHLRKGINRVLIRVENGHSQSEFSLALCTAQ